MAIVQRNETNKSVIAKYFWNLSDRFDFNVETILDKPYSIGESDILESFLINKKFK